MTVCAAALFTWVYDFEKGDLGLAIIAASDRMLTDDGLGIAYETNRYKASFVGSKLILVSGPIFVHSQLLRNLTKLPDVGDLTTEELAKKYASLLLDYSRDQAADSFLSPLGLTIESFRSEQKLFDPALVADIARQLQNHRIDGDPHAIIAGCEGRVANIYHVDGSGNVTCHDDIGFVSIGNGGIHAAGHFMVQGHSYQSNYYRALLTVYAAKKRSEVAPGVGQQTDMFLITRGGVQRLDERLLQKLDEFYRRRIEKSRIEDETDADALGQFWISVNQPAESMPSNIEPQVLEIGSDTAAAVASDPFEKLSDD